MLSIAILISAIMISIALVRSAHKIGATVSSLNERLSSIDYNLMVSAQKLDNVSDLSGNLVHLEPMRYRVESILEKMES